MKKQVGVKKIKLEKGDVVLNKPSIGVVLKADTFANFAVSEWQKDTTDADKNQVTWSLQDKNRSYVILQYHGQGQRLTNLKISKKQSGKEIFYLEASINGERNKKELTGLFVAGNCTPLITKSGWSKTLGGESIKNSGKSKTIKYGEDIHLYLEAEGLNGYKFTIEIYNRVRIFEDKKVFTFTNVLCLEGEVNIEIKNTYSWYAQIDSPDDVEEFYVKIKIEGENNYLKDSRGDDLHAIYLNIKNEIVSRKPAGATNITPSKVGTQQANIQKYDYCRFSKLEMKDEEDSVVLFDEKKMQLVGVKRDQFYVTNEIRYDFNKWNIRADAKPTLNQLANFLLESRYVPVELGSHTDNRGSEAYNMELSEKRAKTVVDYLIGRGVSQDRISARGYGESMLVVKGDNISEAEHQQNRRTTLFFKVFGHDAEKIVFETIAPDIDTKKEITLTISDFEVVKCILQSDKHKRSVIIAEYTGNGNKTNPPIDGNVIKHGVFGNLAELTYMPIKYIWPAANNPNQFLYYVNTCAYYSDKKRATVLVRVFSDIKWELKFFVNLSNDLRVKWQNQSADEHKKLQEKAGKIGAERRWKQKEASFGFSLKANWNKISKDKYAREKEFKASFEKKFKKLYDVFSSVGAMADGITNKTKGNVRNMGFKNLPITFAVKAPNISLSGEWKLERAIIKEKAIPKIGTKIKITFQADPLIGLEMTIDLLTSAVGVVAGAVSGGSASKPAMELTQMLRDKIKKGVDIGSDDFGVKASADVYIDLVISSTISTSLSFEFNTESDKSNSALKLEATNKLKVELKAGLWVKGELTIFIVKAEAYFEMSGKGAASVTFGVGLNYDKNGLYLRPQLGFDGLDVEYVIKGKAGISIKKKGKSGTAKVNLDDDDIKSQGKKRLIEKFDVIKSLEELFGFSANIPLIRSNDD
jgi:outer membrane protein OmpA-like peptidoglycan-associated protein